MREERRMKVFENGVLRRIFGSKRDGLTEEWRRLDYEESYDLL
jgi:cell division protein FtsL